MSKRIKNLIRALLPKVTVKNTRIDRELMMRYLARSVDPAGHHVEVGAGTGIGGPLTGAYGLPFDRKRCFMIEACPVNFAELQKNMNGARLFQLAIASKPGQIQFYTIDDPNWIGSSKANSLHYDALKDKFPPEKIKEIVVPAQTLGAFLDEHSLTKAETLWLNCEGAEYEIFRGDNGFLDRFRFVWLDMHGHTRMYGRMQQTKLDLFDLFVAHGFARVGGHRRDDIDDNFGHMTFLWERLPAATNGRAV
jgi:FkbM family methyltransferase